MRMNARGNDTRLALGGIIVLLGLTWLALAGPAAAHALPERANPPIDGRVAAAPTKVEVWFSQEVDPSQARLTVIAPDGSQVDKGDTAIDLNDPHHQHVTVSLQPGLGPGHYTVQWHSQSIIDSDAVDGSFRFTISPGANQASVPTRAATAAASGALAVPTSAALPAPLPAHSAAPVASSTDQGKSKSSSSRTIVIAIVVIIGLVIIGRISRQGRQLPRR